MSKLALLALSLPLAFAMGCGDSPSSDNTNTPGDVGGGDNDNGGGTGDLGVIESGLVVAQAPEGLTGDFYFADDLVCAGAASCEANVEGEIAVRLECVGKLFVPKSAVGNPNKDVQVTWSTPGDWGLAPSGTYFHEQDLFEGPVTTWVEGDQILLDFDGTVIGSVEGESFAWTSEGGSKYSGTISADLRTINFHTVKANGKEFDEVLTLVE